MKTFLKKWLEVPDMVDYVKKSDIKEAVEDAIYEALQPELPPGYKSIFWHRNRDRDIRGTLEKQVKLLLSRDAKSEIQKNIDKLVGAEKFVDDIVARIMSKQLT